MNATQVYLVAGPVLIEGRAWPMVGHGMWPFGLLSVPLRWRWGSLAVALYWWRT